MTTVGIIKSRFNICRKYNKVEYVDYRINEKGDDTASKAKEYSTDAYTRRAKEIIDAHPSDKPLFMYLAYQAPHSPIQVFIYWIFLIFLLLLYMTVSLRLV